MKNINWYKANYKDWLGLSAAPVFWIASLICFVLGLQFKTGTGIMIPWTTIDAVSLFSIGLGFANTALQVVGNDTEKEELGMPLFLMWMASYALGIGSNVNFLYSVIGLNGWFLQGMVCWGLGIMIEVAPERLLVKFLRSVGVLQSKPVQSAQSNQSTHSQKQPPQEQSQRPQNNKPRNVNEGDIPEFLKRLQQQNQSRPSPRPVPVSAGDPTYHPVTYEKKERSYDA